MKFLRLMLNGHAASLLISFLLLLHFDIAAQNPTVTIVPLPGNIYSIGVTALNNSDKVFYRFSDSHDMIAISTITNPEAKVQRKFKVSNATVSAYIARKNGPIDLAIGNVNNPFCGTCQPPAIGLNQGEYVRLRATSWDAFVEPANPDPLIDNKTNPSFVTPGIPWYFLPVTIKSPVASSRVFISVPEGMSVKGVIVKDTYKSVFVSGLTFEINDSDLKSCNYPAPDRFFLNLSNVVNNEFNAYLIIAGETELGSEANFEGKLYDPSGNQWGATSQQLVVTHQNPHDPNVLTPSQTGVCVMQNEPINLDYKVEFQNLGEGYADQVDVKVVVSMNVLDPMEVQAQMISSSHPLTSFEKFPDKIIFHFEDINLLGLAAIPVPPLSATMGWVKVSIPTRRCVPELPPPHLFRTEGFVTFFNHHNQFEETIQTNNALQKLWECGNSPECEHLSENNDNFATNSNYRFDAKCFPSLVDDNLFIQCNAGPDMEPVKVKVSEVSGRTWNTYEYEAMPNVMFQTSLNMNGFPAGLYLVQISQGAETAVIKVLKK